MPPLHDDLGRPINRVSVLDLRRKAGAPGYPSRESADRIRWAIESVRRTSSMFSMPGLVVAGGCLTWFVGSGLVSMVLLMLPIQGSSQLAAQGLGRLAWLILVIVMTGMLTRMVIRRNMAPHIAATLVAESFCGGCAYGLSTIGPDAAGIVTCPECGAGWRKSRMIALTAEEARKHSGPPLHRQWIGYRRPSAGPDDRGRLVPIMDTRLRVLTRPRQAELGRERVSTLTRSARRVGRWQRAVGLILLLLLATPFLVIAAQAAPLRNRGLSDMIAPGLFGCFFIGMGVLIWRSEMGTKPRTLTECFRAIQCCPSCGEDLSAVPAGADGLRECPTCLACWNLRRSVSPPPASPPNAPAPLAGQPGPGGAASEGPNAMETDRPRA